MKITRSNLLASGENNQARRNNAGSLFRNFKPGLRFKIIALVYGVSFASLLFSAGLLYTIERQRIIESAGQAAYTLGSTIKANLRHAMLFVDWQMANEVLRSVVDEGSVNSVRVFSTKGDISASSLQSEVGKRYDQTEAVCSQCHDRQTGPLRTSVIHRTETGRDVLLSVNLFPNDTDCQKCHGTTQKNLGMLMLEAPLDSVERQLNTTMWQTVLLALGTVAIMGGVLMTSMRRYIINPVLELEKGVAEIMHGNLEGQVHPTSQDELGRLAQSFNTMRKQLSASHVEMDDRNQELLVLNEVALTLSQSLDLQTVLLKATELVIDRLKMESCFIRLVDYSSGALNLVSSRGATDEFIRRVERRRKNPGNDISRLVVETGRSYFAQNVAEDPLLKDLWDDEDARSYILIPLKSKGNVVGTLGVSSFAGRPMTERAVVVIEAMANEIGIAIDNALLLAESHKNEQEALTLQQLGTQVSASLALREVLNAVAEAARNLLNAEVGLVGLIEDGNPELILKAAAGIHADAFTGVKLPLIGPAASFSDDHFGIPESAGIVSREQPVMFDQRIVQSEQFVSFLAVPLERGSQVQGVVEVITRSSRRFTARDVLMLQRLAHHVVVAIENARLYRQLRYLAVLEERDRLAREIHDHLSQTLGYMSIKTSMIDDLLKEEKKEKALESLQELKRVTNMAYTDVREAIFNLRAPVSPGIGLLGSLNSYLTEYRTFYGLDARLIVEDGDLADISPEVASQVMRVIQEALVNVRKHAEASKVRIICRAAGESVCFHIEDDGRGFVLDRIDGQNNQHYGLQIMRERAESVGGSLSLVSEPGQGTRVILCVPTLYYEEEGM